MEYDMSNLRRYFNEGNICFITNVTYKRMPILIENIDILFQAFNNVQGKALFDIIAWVVLADHFHIVLDPGGYDPSGILQKIKMSFASSYRKRTNMHSGRVWQNRFWDHILRDQDDLNRHIDYIHFNPAKHGYVIRPAEWQYSSMIDYLDNGIYSSDWGVVEPKGLDGEFGE